MTDPQVGESFIGDGANAAHINTVLGLKGGPAGVAWVTALATPRPGHVPFVTVLRPGLPVRPLTLFVNKATVAKDEHATLTWGPAQAGVAVGVANAVADGIVPTAAVDDLLIIAAVWVNPAASDAAAVFANNREATRRSLEAGRDGTPPLEEVLGARDRPENPFYSYLSSP